MGQPSTKWRGVKIRGQHKMIFRWMRNPVTKLNSGRICLCRYWGFHVPWLGRPSNIYITIWIMKISATKNSPSSFLFLQSKYCPQLSIADLYVDFELRIFWIIIHTLHSSDETTIIKLEMLIFCCFSSVWIPVCISLKKSLMFASKPTLL